MNRSLDGSWLDVKLGARMLWKYPGLSVIGGVAMAVAMAFGTASFAFFHANLDSDLPFPGGDRVVALENWDVKKNNEERRQVDDLIVWRREMKTVEGIGAFRNIGRNLIVPGRSIESIRIAEITADGFAIPRTPPLLGRPILPSDESREASPVLVIGYDAWQSRFSGDPSVIGRSVRLGASPHTIVGVMPEGFAFPMNHDFWTPLRLEPGQHPPGEGPAIFVFGRLAPGATLASAQAELSAIAGRRAAEHPATHGHLRAQVLPYTYTLLDIQDVTLWQVAAMQGMVSMLLVIVALNVAILVYARTAARQAEIAIRSALGASRLRIVSQLFIEALVLALAAGAVGVGIARFALAQGFGIMQTEFGRLPFWMDDGIPPAALLYVGGVIVCAALIAGVLPAWQATRARAIAALRQGSGGTGLQLGTTWTVLIVGQVAMAVAGLPAVVSEGWREVRQGLSAPTFAVNEYVSARLALQEAEPPPGLASEAHQAAMRSRVVRLQNELASEIEGEPSVVDVTMATGVPGAEPSARIATEEDSARPSTEVEVRSNRVAVDFFDAFDMRVLTGRAFAAGDTTAIVVNRTFAQRVFGTMNVLGRRIRYASSEEAGEDAPPKRWYEIVGVVSDLYTNTLSPEVASAELYHPLEAAPVPAAVIVRVQGGDPTGVADRMREIAVRLEPDVRVAAIPLTRAFEQDRLALRLVAFVLGSVMLSVLLLSGAGIYALVSFTVARRRREIGIRTALGADATRLLRNVFARAVGQIALGIIIGGVTISTLDVVSGGAVLDGRVVLLPVISLLMVTAGLIAVVGPARRVLKIQPIEALRED